MTINKVLEGLYDNSPIIGSALIIIWLSLPQLAERFVVIGKMVAPLSRRWRDKAERIEAARREGVLVEAKRLAAIAMQEMTPPDVVEMARRLARFAETLESVQDAEDLLRAFVIYDELWHFHDDHNEARRGRPPAHRMSFDAFEAKWKEGWRPFDERGKYTGDAGPEGDLPNDDRALNQYRAPDD